MDELKEAQPKTLWFKMVLFAGMLLFAFYASTHMVAAGDTWVAMACGRHFDNHGVDTVEPFSFNSHPAGPSEETLEKFPAWSHGIIKKWHPTGWLNQNWLTHLGFYKLATWFGDGDSYNLNALVYWKFAIYFIAVFAVYGTGKTLGAGDTLSAAAACLAMVVGRSFYDIRPAGYSNMLVPVFVLILAVTMCKNYRLIWLAVPVIVFWANVHGGYLYAFIMFVPFIGINLLLRLPKRWTICVGLCSLWLLLYLMSYKFVSGYVGKIEYFASQLQSVYVWSDGQTAQFSATQIEKIFGYDASSISLLNNLLWIWFVLAGASVAITCFKRVQTGVYYFFHLFVGGVYFVSLIPRFLTEPSGNLPKYFASDAFNSLVTFGLIYVAGIVMVLLLAHKKERFLCLPTKGIGHAIAAAAAAFIAMVVFNPFHLTNLTHTFEISLSKHAESWRQVNEWKPAFDWMDKTTQTPNPVGNEEWFATLCVLMLAALGLWLISYFLKPRTQTATANRKKRPPETAEKPPFEWPKINLPIIVIALLTIYMAIRSRRFIAIAGSAAAPVLAMFILQSWQMISSRIQLNLTGLQKSWTLPTVTQTVLKSVICFLLVGLTIYWGSKYKRVYLDPWPTDHQYNSVFMRMTASHLKPTDACKFIRDNEISGKMFNYWTEGGAVAFGQEPDPETGHIPLKLFMDGRAQAAYNHDKFKLWQEIFAGGPLVREAKTKKKKLDAKKYQEIGNWITERIGDEVWVVLMPKSQDNSTFMKSLTKTGYWKTAYIDDYQHMIVNTQTPQGETLIGKILQDDVSFPNQHAKSMTTCSVIFENRVTQRYKDLYQLSAAAFKEFPTPSSFLTLTRLKAFPAFKEQVNNDAKNYIADFKANKDTYVKEDGYFQRLTCARMAINFLMKELPDSKNEYSELVKELKPEVDSITENTVW